MLHDLGFIEPVPDLRSATRVECLGLRFRVEGSGFGGWRDYNGGGSGIGV